MSNADFRPYMSANQPTARMPSAAKAAGKLASRPSCMLVRPNSSLTGMMIMAKIAISHPSETELENVMRRAICTRLR